MQTFWVKTGKTNIIFGTVRQAGTGNLLADLTNKYNIFASTLDKQDVGVMHDRINNDANLLHEQVFQFDFLNDDFKKLPKILIDIQE